MIGSVRVVVRPDTTGFARETRNEIDRKFGNKNTLLIPIKFKYDREQLYRQLEEAVRKADNFMRRKENHIKMHIDVDYDVDGWRKQLEKLNDDLDKTLERPRHVAIDRQITDHFDSDADSDSVTRDRDRSLTKFADLVGDKFAEANRRLATDNRRLFIELSDRIGKQSQSQSQSESAHSHASGGDGKPIDRDYLDGYLRRLSWTLGKRNPAAVDPSYGGKHIRAYPGDGMIDWRLAYLRGERTFRRIGAAVQPGLVKGLGAARDWFSRTGGIAGRWTAAKAGEFVLRSTGVWVIGDIAGDMIRIIPKLDGMVVQASKLATSIAVIGTSITALGGHLTAILADIGRMFKVTLIAPALLSAGAAAFYVFKGARAESAKLFKDLTKKFSDLQSTLGKVFWKQGDKGSKRKFLEQLLPMMAKDMPALAKYMGAAYGGLFDGARSVMGKTVPEFLKNTARLFQNLVPGANALGRAWMNLSAVGSRVFPNLGNWVSDVAVKFDNWVAKNGANGNIVKWINEGAKAAADFGNVLVGLTRVIGGLGKAAISGGAWGLEKLGKGLNGLANLINTDLVQNELSNLMAVSLDFFTTIGERTGEQFKTAFGNAFNHLESLFVDLAEPIGKAFNDILTGFNNPHVQDGISDLIKGLGVFIEDIGPGLKGVVETFGPMGSTLAAGLESWGKPLSKVIETIAKMGESIHPGLIDWVKTLGGAVEGAVDKIAPAAVKMSESLNKLLSDKEFQSAFAGLASSLGDFWREVARFLASDGVREAIKGFVVALAGLVKVAADIGATVLPVFTALSDFVGKYPRVAAATGAWAGFTLVLARLVGPVNALRVEWALLKGTAKGFGKLLVKTPGLFTAIGKAVGRAAASIGKFAVKIPVLGNLFKNFSLKGLFKGLLGGPGGWALLAADLIPADWINNMWSYLAKNLSNGLAELTKRITEFFGLKLNIGTSQLSDLIFKPFKEAFADVGKKMGDSSWFSGLVKAWWHDFTGVFKNAWNGDWGAAFDSLLGTVLMPVGKALFDSFIRNIKEMWDKIDFGKAMSDLWTGLVDKIKSFFGGGKKDEMILAGGGVPGGMGPMMVLNTPQNEQGFKDLAVKWVKSFVSGLATGAAQVASSVAGWVTSALSALAGQAGQLVSSAFNWVKSFVSGLLSAPGQIVSAIWNWITGASSTLSGGVGSIVSAVAGWVSGAVQMLAGGVGALVSTVTGWAASLGQAAAGIFPAIRDAVGNIGDKLAQFFEGTVPALAGWFSGLGGRIGSWLAGTRKTVADTASNVGSRTADMARSAGRGMSGVADWFRSGSRKAADAVLGVLIPGAKSGAREVGSSASSMASRFGEGARALVSNANSGQRGVTDAMVQAAFDVATSGLRMADAAREAGAGMGNALRSAGAATSNAMRTAINTVVNVVRSGMSTVKSVTHIDLGGNGRHAGGTFVSGVGTIRSAIGVARGAASGIRSALSFSAYGSGRTIASTFASGIRAGIGWAASAASRLAAAARNFLPHSPAKEGPFSGSGWGGWGESIAQELADGLRRGTSEVSDAAESMMSAAEKHLGLDLGRVESIIGYRDRRLDDSVLGDKFQPGFRPGQGQNITINVESRSDEPLREAERFAREFAFAVMD